MQTQDDISARPTPRRVKFVYMTFEGIPDRIYKVDVWSTGRMTSEKEHLPLPWANYHLDRDMVTHLQTIKTEPLVHCKLDVWDDNLSVFSRKIQVKVEIDE